MRREAEVARMLVEDADDVIWHHVFVGVDKIRCVVRNSACEMLDTEGSSFKARL